MYNTYTPPYYIVFIIISAMKDIKINVRTRPDSNQINIVKSNIKGMYIYIIL